MTNKEKKTETPIATVSKLTKVYNSYMNGEMAKNGMKRSYRHLLRPLAVKDGVTQLDLVKESGLKAPTVSTTLRSMEAEGFVRRETDKDDARATRVYITQFGKTIDNKMKKSIKKADEIFAEDITPEEFEAAMNVIRKMTDNMLKKTGGKIADEAK